VLGNVNYVLIKAEVDDNVNWKLNTKDVTNHWEHWTCSIKLLYLAVTC